MTWATPTPTSPSARRTRNEIRYRDRKRRNFAAGNGNARLSERVIHAAQNQAARCQPRKELPAVHAEWRFGQLGLF